MIKILEQLFKDLGIKIKPKPVLSKEDILAKLANTHFNTKNLSLPNTTQNKPSLPKSPQGGSALSNPNVSIFGNGGASSPGSIIIPNRNVVSTTVLNYPFISGSISISGVSFSGWPLSGIITGQGTYGNLGINQYADYLKDRRPDYEKMWDVYVKNNKNLDPKEVFMAGAKYGWGTAKVLQ